MNKSELLQDLNQAGIVLWHEGETLRYRAPSGSMTAERLALLRQHKAELLVELAQQKNCWESDQQQRYAPFPLTDLQSAYLLGRRSLFALGDVDCHGYMEFQFERLDVPRLQHAWNEMIAHHDMLRTVVYENGTQQTLKDLPSVQIPESDFRHLPPEQQRENWLQQREAMSLFQGEPDEWPLIKLRVSRLDTGAFLHISFNLLICDFHSARQLLNELSGRYFATGSLPTPPTITFRDYVLSSQKQKALPAWQQARNYWLQRLPQLPGVPLLPAANQPVTKNFWRLTFTLTPPQVARLSQFSAQQQVGLTSLFLTLYAATLHRWGGGSHFCLSLTMMQRLPLHQDVDRLIGDFSSVELLEVVLDRSASLAQQSQNIQQQLWRDLDHSAFSGIEVIRELARQRGRDAALYPVAFTSTLGNGNDCQAELFPGARLAWSITQTPQIALDCQIGPGEEGLVINWDMREGAIDPAMASAMFGAFQQSVLALSEDAVLLHQPIRLPLPADQQQRRQRLNATAYELPTGLLHTPIWQQAQLTPDATALIDTQGTLSYRELIEQAEGLAARLLQRGVKPGELVAIALEKGHRQIVAVLAVLRAGAVWFPLDVALPVKRQHWLLELARPVQIIALSNASFAASHLPILPIDMPDPAPLPTQWPTVGKDTLAYVIFTSGSTGEPKGVMISHSAACNTIADINHRLHLQPNDRLLGLANLSFDLAVYDIFGPLSGGAALVLPAQQQRSNPAQLVQLIDRHAISLWNSVPAQFAMLVDYLPTASAPSCSTLRGVLLSGDWIPVDLPERAKQQLPAAQLYGLGGATEAAIWSVIYPIQHVETHWPSIPYGKPLTNQRLYVLDKQLHDVPEGVAGELYIGGTGLALGYWGDSEKTAQHFIYHPQSGERLYRTGDLACHLPDGNLQFLGREDAQLKVRGHRIELAEIEATLVRHEAVSSAAALAIDRGKATQKLVAFTAAASRVGEDHATRLPITLPQAAQQLATALDINRTLQMARGIETVSLKAMTCALSTLVDCAPGQPPASLESLEKSGSVAQRHLRLMGRWLDTLCQQGYLQQTDEGHFVLQRRVTREEVDADWQMLQQIDQQINWGSEILRYMQESHRALPALMRNEVDPLDLLFPQGQTHVAESAYRDNLVSRTMNALVCAAIRQIAEEKKGKTLRLLEVGAGVGGTSLDLIPALAEYPVDYLFTDVSHYFLNEAEKRFSHWPWVRYALYDINQPALMQGIEPSSKDVILCANVLHNSHHVADVLVTLRDILAPGGWLVFIEATTNSYQIMSSMEFKEGLSGFADCRGELGTTFLTTEQWQHYLQQAQADRLVIAPQPELDLRELGQQVFAAQFKTQQIAVTAEDLRQHLGQWLPGWMQPDIIYLLEKLPLSANGKIDRKALAERVPAQRIVLKHKAEPPATALERDIAAIWQSVLKVETIGRHDNFFDLGGDSLLVAQAVSKMRAALPQISGWHWDTLLRAMVNGGCVAALAERFSQRSDSSYALLELQPGKHSATTLLLVHDGSGTLAPYRALVDKVASRQRILGLALNTPEKFLAHPAEQGINLLAAQAIQTLQAQDNLGSLHIVGYCLGGMLAREIARQLTASGHDVTRLSIISSYPVPFRIDDDLLAEYIFARVMQADPLKLGYPADEAGFQQLLQAILQQTPGVIPQGSLAHFSAGKTDPLSQALLRLAAQTPSQRLDAIRQQMRYADSNLSTPERVTEQYRLIRHSLLAVHGHRLETDDLPVTFLRQQGEMQILPGMNAEMTEFWQQSSRQPLVLRDIPGDHFSCLSLANVSAVIQALGLETGGTAR